MRNTDCNQYCAIDKVKIGTGPIKGVKYILPMRLGRVKIWDKSYLKIDAIYCLFWESQNLRQIRKKYWKISASIEKVKIWDKSTKSVGKYLLLLRKSKFETNLQKVLENICFYWESQNLGQIYKKCWKISASIEKVKIWDNSAKTVGKYQLLLRKSKFETILQKVLENISFY